MNRKIKGTLSIIIIAFFSVSLVVGQAPQAIPYQAAARNSSGVVIANKTVMLRFTLHDSIANGATVYQETQSAGTNALGLFMVNVGQGMSVSGTFSSINWGNNAKFMQVELDTTGKGCCYVNIGTQQLMSVPYALNSGNGVPTGTIEAFAGDTSMIPKGWVLCDGRNVSKTDPVYSNLYRVIKLSWGNSSGISGYFNLPWTKGMFLRGASLGDPNWDPDRNTRSETYPGGNKGDNVGTIQSNALAYHNHSINDPGHAHTSPTWAGGGGGYEVPSGKYNMDYADGAPTSTSATGITINNAGTSYETRPSNVYVNYIIKL